MEQATDQILKYAITLLSIINPLGILPIFLSMTNGLKLPIIKKVSKSSSIAVVITLSISMIIGQKLLNFFGISIASFRIGGGLLIFTMAFSMISARTNSMKISQKEIQEQEDSANEIGIVPLAIPLLAGPGAISTSIVHSQNFTTMFHWLGALLVILIIGSFIFLAFRYSRIISDKLGLIGLNIMTRIMGIILLALSIEMILGGIKDIIPILKGHL